MAPSAAGWPRPDRDRGLLKMSASQAHLARTLPLRAWRGRNCARSSVKSVRHAGRACSNGPDYWHGAGVMCGHPARGWMPSSYEARGFALWFRDFPVWREVECVPLTRIAFGPNIDLASTRQAAPRIATDQTEPPYLRVWSVPAGKAE